MSERNKLPTPALLMRVDQLRAQAATKQRAKAAARPQARPRPAWDGSNPYMRGKDPEE